MLATEPAPIAPIPPVRSPRQFYLSRWWFLRTLGVIYLIAFASLLPQLEGLLGAHGLLPAALRLRLLAVHAGTDVFFALPSLLWFHPDTAFLHTLCAAGISFSVMLLLGAAPRLSAAACWLLYLSIASVGGAFFSYQWDGLLLETGLLAIFLAPRGLMPRRPGPPPSSWAFVWLGRLILVKLLLGSGLVKLLSGDGSWPGLTALTFHFETQPLPTAFAWQVHHLSAPLLAAATAALLTVELLAVLFIFGPKRLPALAAAVLIPWFALVSLTGNHAFLNLLAIALCLLLVDDDTWRRLRRRRQTSGTPPPLRLAPGWRVLPHGMVLALVSTLSVLSALSDWLPASWLGGPPRALLRAVAPLRSFNSYGMFASMTRTRREIIIEGTLDGRQWHPYEFRWKPGNIRRAPALVAPYQPRLDWQMWFAALPGQEPPEWFDTLLERLLENDPAVLSLLDENPFGLWPPRQVRASLFEYHFTSREERERTGHWWWRRKLETYAPARELPVEQRTPRLPRGATRT